MREYKCSFCNAKFKTESDVVYCPCCAGSQLIDISHARAKATAVKKIAEFYAIQERIDKKYAEFIELYVQAESVLQVLRQYKHRGIITSDDVPSLNKPKLSESLKEYRNKNKKH